VVLLLILSGKTLAQDEKRADLTQKPSKMNENSVENAKIPSPASENEAPEAVRLPLATYQKAALAWQAYQNRDYELATEYFDEVGGYFGWFNAGDAAYRNKDYESAVFYFRQALLSAGNDRQRARALYNLGNTYYQSNLLPLAIEAYQGALLYQPDYAKAKHNLAVAQWRLKQERMGKKKKGAGGGKSSKDNEGAFYGGQKPSEQNEPGKGGDGDAPEGNKNGKDFQLPPAEDEQQYDLTAQPISILTEEGNAILSQQAQARKIERLEQSLQQVEDKQSELLQRLFEREEGFEAHQTEKHQLPGVQPW
jgi:Ca-activated chloride channel family protein